MPLDIQTYNDFIYDALYQAVGDGLRGPRVLGSPEQTSIVEKWRSAKAQGIAFMTKDWEAFHEAFPSTTQYVPVFESLMRYVVDRSATLVDQQAELSAKYIQVVDATGPSLNLQMDEILEDFEIVLPDPFEERALSFTTDQGMRPFQDWNPADIAACGPDFDFPDRDHSLVPNYSSDFIIPVQLTTGSGGYSVSEQRKISELKERLNDVLPAWVDYRVFRDLGFILDEDLLDVTAFGDGLSL